MWCKCELYRLAGMWGCVFLVYGTGSHIQSYSSTRASLLEGISWLQPEGMWRKTQGEVRSLALLELPRDHGEGHVGTLETGARKAVDSSRLLGSSLLDESWILREVRNARQALAKVANQWVPHRDSADSVDWRFPKLTPPKYWNVKEDVRVWAFTLILLSRSSWVCF